MVSGRLFHKEGSMYDKVFCPMLVLQKGKSLTTEGKAQLIKEMICCTKEAAHLAPPTSAEKTKISRP